MSLVEIKQELQRMTAEELAEVEGFLRALRVKNSPEFRKRIAEANAEMDAGRKVSQQEVEAYLKHRREKSA